MQHKGTFHQELHCLLRSNHKNNLHGQKCIINRNCDRQPFKIETGEFNTYCISMYGIIHQNEKDETILGHPNNSDFLLPSDKNDSKI